MCGKVAGLHGLSDGTLTGGASQGTSASPPAAVVVRELFVQGTLLETVLETGSRSAA